jgi:hypothetical protein
MEEGTKYACLAFWASKNVKISTEALAQIEKNNYAAEWIDEGYTDIMKYGIAFYKKRCMVRKDESGRTR